MSPGRKDSWSVSPVLETSTRELDEVLAVDEVGFAVDTLPVETVVSTVGGDVAVGVGTDVDPTFAAVVVACATATAVTDAAFDTADNVKPGVSGWVSRSDKSDC